MCAEDCRQDLQRDEEIFTEKFKELKSARKKIRMLEDENSTLKRQLERLPPGPGPSTRNSYTAKGVCDCMFASPSAKETTNGTLNH